MLEGGPNRERPFTRACTRGHGQVMNTGVRLACLWVTPLLFGCADHDQPSPSETEGSFESLVELEAWSAVARADDPFVDVDAPPDACVSPGVRVEDAQHWLELDTGQCGFITVSAEARFAITRGTRLRLALSHFDLDAAEPASAELRLSFDGCPVWESSIAIPQPASVYELEFDSGCAVAQGGQVLFHLRNHGQNTYQLRDISALR
jgi:hypothetical protein